MHADAGERIIPGSDKSKLYYIWRGMIRRCYEPSVKAYRWYGKRGIAVCEEWRKSYELFREWSLNNGYAEGLSIDRINSDGNYAPLNCQWITRSENSKRAALKRWGKIK